MKSEIILVEIKRLLHLHSQLKNGSQKEFFKIEKGEALRPKDS